MVEHSEAGERSSTRSERPAKQLLYRRAVAFLVELTFVNVFVMPVVWLLVGDRLTGTLSHLEMIGPLKYDLSTPLALLAFVLARDLAFGGTSPGKRLVGLRVVSTGESGQADGRPSVGKRLLRNTTLVVPAIMWIIEYEMANRDQGLRRLGDKLAGTTVVDTNPAVATKPWGWILAATLLITGVLRMQLTPAVYGALSGFFG